ncbi:50S ribosomal protein L19 [Geodia barretti]|uniref:Large ribosomal subunit protein bL19m n=1 Tax=Geodia barretti TaxID=519541 RepID=A0AA35RQJ0_GEOBA|nr:50S ribosomal protein L19 [Geodia barretti]
MNAAEIYKTEANPRIPRFSAGDTVRVNFRIREGERERIQAFQGVVIRLNNGKGPAANFTVRRISAGIGIERIFPMHSPLIESLEITRYGSVRRAKLYYLRGLQGRAARIKEMNPAQRRRATESQAAAAARREEAALAAAEAEALEQAAAEAEAEADAAEAVAEETADAEQPATEDAPEAEEPAAEADEQPVSEEQSTDGEADEQPGE